MTIRDLPWLRFLPDEDRDEFFAELPRALLESMEVGSSTPIVQMLTEWQATAEVHADPKLARSLRRPLDIGIR